MKQILIAIFLIFCIAGNCFAGQITYADKVKSDGVLPVNDNEKVSYSDMNQIKEEVNDNYSLIQTNVTAIGGKQDDLNVPTEEQIEDEASTQEYVVTPQRLDQMVADHMQDNYGWVSCKTNEPTGEWVNQRVWVCGYTGGYDPLDLHTSEGYDDPYEVICTATGTPWTVKLIGKMTGGQYYRAYSVLTVPNTSTGDQTLTSAQIGIKLDEDVVCIHGGASGEVQDEACFSLLDPFIVPFDPEVEYDTTTNHVISIHKLGDAEPHGVTLAEWSCEYINGDPTTELDMDLICDSTPDWNPAAGATVMDVLDTTAGSSSADTGFDSATCANGNNMYLRFGADPVDSGERVHCEFIFYKNED